VKLRRPAALAIVGWYLMAPPAKSTLPEQTTPLSAWNVIQSFDSATDYQDAKERDQQTSDKEVAGVVNGLGPLPGHNEYQARLGDRLIRSAQCVATDDPRLKGN
jgi:hypothetical protein